MSDENGGTVRDVPQAPPIVRVTPKSKDAKAEQMARAFEAILNADYKRNIRHFILHGYFPHD